MENKHFVSWIDKPSRRLECTCGWRGRAPITTTDPETGEKIRWTSHPKELGILRTPVEED